MKDLINRMSLVSESDYSKEYENYVLYESLASTGINTYIHLVIVMEELAELQQAISKLIRFDGDRLNLTEEIADVEIGLEYLYKIYDVNKDDINKIKYLKLKRLEDILNGKTISNDNTGKT